LTGLEERRMMVPLTWTRNGRGKKDGVGIDMVFRVCGFDGSFSAGRSNGNLRTQIAV